MRRKSEVGFTLVELLVVIAILGVTVGVTSGILLSLMKSYSKTQVLDEIEQQANFATMKMEKELRNGYWVFLPTQATPGNRLLFYTKDGIYISYYVNNGILGRQVFTVNNLGQTQIIDTSGVTDNSPYNNGIGGVIVECIGTGGNCFSLESAVTPQIVSISMRFRQAQQSPLNVFAGDVKVLDSIVLRSTY